MKQGIGQGAAGLCRAVGHPGSGQEGTHEDERQMDGRLFGATPMLRVVWAAKALLGSLPTSAPDGGFHQAEAEVMPRCLSEHRRAPLRSRCRGHIPQTISCSSRRDNQGGPRGHPTQHSPVVQPKDTVLSQPNPLPPRKQKHRGKKRVWKQSTVFWRHHAAPDPKPGKPLLKGSNVHGSRGCQERRGARPIREIQEMLLGHGD